MTLRVKDSGKSAECVLVPQCLHRIILLCVAFRTTAVLHVLQKTVLPDVANNSYIVSHSVDLLNFEVYNLLTIGKC